MRVERRIGQVGLVAVAADIITAFDVVLATALASLCLIVAHWISIADGTAVFVRIVRATVGLHRLLRLLHWKFAVGRVVSFGTELLLGLPLGSLVVGLLLHGGWSLVVGRLIDVGLGVAHHLVRLVLDCISNLLQRVWLLIHVWSGVRIIGSIECCFLSMSWLRENGEVLFTGFNDRW